VAGDGNDKGPAGARPVRIRPHWWAVLAVSLSLLALVAAAASNHPSNSPHGRASLRSHPATSQPTLPAPTTSTPASAPASPTSTTSVASTTSTPSPPRVVTTAGTRVGAGVANEPSSAPTATSTTSVPPAGPGLAAATTQTTQPADKFARTGTLQQPDIPFASYTFYGVGSMTVSATWTFATPLSLTVTCPGGAQTRVETSPISVMIPNAGGDCSTVLKETLVQYDAVDFTLKVGPTDGS
jgi:hypothetical protein